MNRQALRDFWDEALAELAGVEIDAQVKPVASSDPLVTEYEVSLQSIGGVRIAAIYTMPAWSEAQPFPALITMPGYGGDTPPQRALSAEAGYAVLSVYPRAQGPSRSLWDLPEGYTKLTFGLHDPRDHYYRAAYMDVVRGVDFLLTRPEVDSERIGVYGTSQGGGLTLALAALDKRVKAAAAHVPFLCAYRIAVETATTGPYLELIDYFTRHPDEREQALRTLEYFDPVNLARWIEVPTLVTIGDQDTTCPPATIEAVFDQLRCTRALVRYPELGHGRYYPFRRIARFWFDQYL